MHIYLYLHHFPPAGTPLVGGTAKAVHGLATGLAACGAAVTVLCEGAGDQVVRTAAGYTIRSFASRQSVPLWPSRSLQTFVRHAMRRGFVVLNGMFHPNLYGLSRLLAQQNIPYIVAPHLPYTPLVFRKNAHLKWPYWYVFEHRLLQQATAIQVLHAAHAAPLRERNVQTPVIAIPNGFDPGDVNVDSTLQWRQTGPVQCFFFGRMDAHHKGLDLLITAFDQLAQQVDARLTIQGPDDGDRQRLVQQAAQFASAHRIAFVDPDYTSNPTSLIGRYDVFCLPSRYEGFNLAALEAMLAGRVLMVSEIDGVAPHVKASGCGVAVRPEISSIRNGLHSLIEQRGAWEQMGRAGRRYALEHLNWQQIAATALQQYATLGLIPSDAVPDAR